MDIVHIKEEFPYEVKEILEEINRRYSLDEEKLNTQILGYKKIIRVLNEIKNEENEELFNSRINKYKNIIGMKTKKFEDKYGKYVYKVVEDIVKINSLNNDINYNIE